MRPPWFALYLLPLWANLALAQQNSDPSVFRDSIQQITNIDELRGLLGGFDAGVPATERLARAGWVRLRLHELTGAMEEAAAARAAFEEALEQDEFQAWVHYGLGLSLTKGPPAGVQGPGGIFSGVVLGQSISEILGRDPKSRARQSLRRAVELDPRLAGAALELAELALEAGGQSPLQDARSALHAALQAGSGASRGELATALARVDVALGDASSAAAAAEAALSSGGDPARAYYALATALLSQPGREAEGADAWFKGVDLLSPPAEPLYFAAIEPLVDGIELVSWRTANTAARQTLLREFWELRAARAGITVAERLAEHYRRLALARERYPRGSQRGAPPPGALLMQTVRESAAPWDERGVVLVRHGEPDRIVRTPHAHLRPHETWIYDGPGDHLVFHFVQLADGTGIRLVDDLMTTLDPQILNPGVDPIVRMLEDRVAYDPALQPLLARARLYAAAPQTDPIEGNSTMRRERIGDLSSLGLAFTTLAAERRVALLAALERDSDRPHFERDLPFYYDLLTFRDAAGGTDLTAAFAIPARMLEPHELVDGSWRYSLELSLILADSVSGRVSRTDTVYHFLSPTRLGRDDYVRSHLEVTAWPSDNAFHRVVVRNADDRGQGHLYGGAASLRDYSGATLSLSDVVLAEPAETGRWVRGDVSLALVPPRQFPRRQPMSVFYEIYNLPAGSAYRTELTLENTAGTGFFAGLRRILGGGGAAVRLSFEGLAEPGTDGAVQELRRVTAGLGPGRYRLTIQVTELATGNSTSRTRDFVVLDDS